MTVEYRVRPVTRWIVTQYVSDENGASCGPIGEFDNEQHADLVAIGLSVFHTTREWELMQAFEKEALARKLAQST